MKEPKTSALRVGDLKPQTQLRYVHLRRRVDTALTIQRSSDWNEEKSRPKTEDETAYQAKQGARKSENPATAEVPITRTDVCPYSLTY
jgi:hypothetical protein